MTATAGKHENNTKSFLYRPGADHTYRITDSAVRPRI